MIIISAGMQSFGWDAECGGNGLQHRGRWGAKSVLDLREIGIGYPGKGRELAQRQSSEFPLTADELADQILR